MKHVFYFIDLDIRSTIIKVPGRNLTIEIIAVFTMSEDKKKICLKYFHIFIKAIYSGNF